MRKLVLLLIIVGIISGSYFILSKQSKAHTTTEEVKTHATKNITVPKEKINYQSICNNFTLPTGLKGRAITCEDAIDLLISKGIRPTYLRAFIGNSTEAYYVFRLKNGSEVWVNVFTKEIKFR